MKIQRLFSLLAISCGFYLFFYYHMKTAKAEFAPKPPPPFMRPYMKMPQQRNFVAKAEQGGSGILDTFSLSFVGNFNFANAIEGLRKIVEGIASCTYRVN